MTPFTYNFFVIITNIKYVLGENIQIKIKKGKKHILDFGCIRRYILIPMGWGLEFLRQKIKYFKRSYHHDLISRQFLLFFQFVFLINSSTFPPLVHYIITLFIPLYVRVGILRTCAKHSMTA